jgi:hypothetical protein
MFEVAKGKAKQAAGAVSENESPTTERPLEEARAHYRNAADTVEAGADVQALQALAGGAEAERAAVRERNAVNAETAVAQRKVQAQRLAQTVAADHAGEQTAAAEKISAELEAERATRRANADERRAVAAAFEDVVEAVTEHQTEARLAARAHEEADRVRRRAADLTVDADQP